MPTKIELDRYAEEVNSSIIGVSRQVSVLKSIVDTGDVDVDTSYLLGTISSLLNNLRVKVLDAVEEAKYEIDQKELRDKDAH